MSEKSKSKKSSVRHTRAIQRDRTKRPNSAPPDEQIEARLTELIHPTTYAQVAAFHAMGLRERILTLPVMIAFVLSLIWRHLGSVSEAVRVLQEEGMLWTSPQHVTQSAVEQRLRGLPPLLSWMARPWMGCCAKSGCCVTAKAQSWPDGWRPCSTSSASCRARCGTRRIGTPMISASGSAFWAA